MCVWVCEKCLVQLCGAGVFCPPEICLWRSLGVANLQRELDRITHYRDSLQRDFIYIISLPSPSHSLSSYFSLKLSASTKIMLKIFLSSVKSAVFHIQLLPLFMVLKHWKPTSSPVFPHGPETLKPKLLKHHQSQPSYWSNSKSTPCTVQIDICVLATPIFKLRTPKNLTCIYMG